MIQTVVKRGYRLAYEPHVDTGDDAGCDPAPHLAVR
jgi:DNA-binding winged helix-turn-helix (wHTH) protein